MSSLRRGHANLLCIVPNLIDAPLAGGESGLTHARYMTDAEPQQHLILAEHGSGNLAQWPHCSFSAMRVLALTTVACALVDAAGGGDVQAKPLTQSVTGAFLCLLLAYSCSVFSSDASFRPLCCIALQRFLFGASLALLVLVSLCAMALSFLCRTERLSATPPLSNHIQRQHVSTFDKHVAFVSTGTHKLLLLSAA